MNYSPANYLRNNFVDHGKNWLHQNIVGIFPTYRFPLPEHWWVRALEDPAISVLCATRPREKANERSRIPNSANQVFTPPCGGQQMAKAYGFGRHLP